MSELFDQLIPMLERSAALTAALALFEWDAETLAPEEASDNTGKIIGILSNDYFHSLINPEVKLLLKKLEEPDHNKQLTLEQKAVIKQLRRTYDQLASIPGREYSEFCELANKSSSVWAKARENNDFKSFEPYLEKVVEYKKKFAGYRLKAEGQKEDPDAIYNVLLSDFEPSLSTKELDDFFELIKEELVPLIQEVAEKKDEIDDAFNSQSFDIQKQREFNTFLADYVGFEKEKGVIAESAHPFTTNLHNKDVRMTNHYYENNLITALFSTIHESGHAIYEMQIRDDLTLTMIGAGASMAVHESQSRFYENIIGKSKEFWKPIYNQLVENFPEQLKDVELDQFVKAINKSLPGYIRTDADELTYPMHILIRYELERALFRDEITVKDLPQEWKKKYTKYLGLKEDTDTKGVLQDTHWSGGDFGYFPTYAIGSAVAAQLYYFMKTQMQFEELLEDGNLAQIKKYLGEHIHQYGMIYDMNELLQNVTGEKFNPSYYVKYLKEKYTKLYGLD
ncbi:MAG: carboxypeptidase M32 [bacterium]|nr:carboxypeptidase M32 [bacterium]